MRTLLSIVICCLTVTTVRAAEPSVVDFGSEHCIPCKMMAPILDGLKTSLAGTVTVEFVDVNKAENRARASKAGIKLIPTQIFYDAAGKEVTRHEGYLGKFAILAQLEQMKAIADADAYMGVPKVERWKPAATDERGAAQKCFFSDATIDPAREARIVRDSGTKHLADLHTFFIMYSCLQKGHDEAEQALQVARADGAGFTPGLTATYLYGLDETTGRPWIRAYAERAAAEQARGVHGGSIVAYEVLKAKELEHRCAFCDRSVYAADAALVEIDGVHSWGCCAHCALGVAARTKKDIVVQQPDGQSGEMITIRTMDGQIAAIEPPGAFAWYGKKRQADGSWSSAGCFHQGDFVSEANLQAWLQARPFETGMTISIDRALADKMKLSPSQIAGACKLGECK